MLAFKGSLCDSVSYVGRCVMLGALSTQALSTQTHTDPYSTTESYMAHLTSLNGEGFRHLLCKLGEPRPP